MTLTFRHARRVDLPTIIALMADDRLGSGREVASLEAYLTAFDAITAEPHNELIVGVNADEIVQATYQITYTAGISMAASHRATVESVRVARHLRGQGYGRAMFKDIEIRARAADCVLIQLAMNQTRTESRRFYEVIGFTPSHIGFKRYLN